MAVFIAFSQPGPPCPLSTLILAAAGMVLNLSLLATYFFDPAKFTVHAKHLARRRKQGVQMRKQTTMLLHMAAGIFEIVAMTVRTLALSVPVLLGASYLQAAFSSVHAVTSMFKMRALFGNPALMRAGYGMACLLKLWLCAQLAIQPTSLAVSMQLFVTLSIFAFVRAFYAAWSVLGLFEGFEYSVAVIMAGMTCFPVVCPEANLIAMAGFLGVASLTAAFSPLGVESASLVERSRELLDGLGYKDGAVARCTQVLLQMHPSLRGNSRGPWPFLHLNTSQFKASLGSLWLSDDLKARVTFAALDVDNRGSLTRGALRLLLFHWGHHRTFATELLDIVEGAVDVDEICFETFVDQMAPVWQHLHGPIKVGIVRAHMRERRRWHLQQEMGRPRTFIRKFTRVSSKAAKE